MWRSDRFNWKCREVLLKLICRFSWLAKHSGDCVGCGVNLFQSVKVLICLLLLLINLPFSWQIQYGYTNLAVLLRSERNTDYIIVKSVLSKRLSQRIFCSLAEVIFLRQTPDSKQSLPPPCSKLNWLLCYWSPKQKCVFLLASHQKKFRVHAATQQHPWRWSKLNMLLTKSEQNKQHKYNRGA